MFRTLAERGLGVVGGHDLRTAAAVLCVTSVGASRPLADAEGDDAAVNDRRVDHLIQGDAGLTSRVRGPYIFQIDGLCAICVRVYYNFRQEADEVATGEVTTLE